MAKRAAKPKSTDQNTNPKADPNFDLNELIIQPPEKRLTTLSILNNIFGHPNFKPEQEEIISKILNNQDLFVSMPTSWGKSLCYQLPAVMSHLKGDGITIVISPLIGLMRDQVSSLKAKGLQAISLDTQMSEQLQEQNLKLVKHSSTILVYISPERMLTDKVKKALSGVKIARIVVDEAHCVSMWGHDFRSAYQKIPQAREYYGNPQLVAFTATAPVIMRDDILEMLKIPDAVQVNGDPERRNLDLKVIKAASLEEQKNLLFKKLAKIAKTNEATVVYCQRTKQCEELSAELSGEYFIDSKFYHAQMEAGKRQEAFDAFMNNKCQILFATQAFGLGIDKSNIRNVIHFGLPDSLEQYYQEAGRAGRDSKKSECTLLYTGNDVLRANKILIMSNPSASFIKQFYYRLWSYIKKDDLLDNNPYIRFSLKFFYDNLKITDPARQILYQTALSTLQEFGLITHTSQSVKFLVRKDEIPENEFPITDTLLNTKYQRNRTSQILMIEYACQENPRGFLLDHFRHNSAISQLDEAKLFRNFVPTDFTSATLEALNKRDYDKSDLVSYLMKYSKDNEQPFQHLSNLEVRNMLEHLSYNGTVKFVKAGEKTFVTSGKITDFEKSFFHHEIPEIEHFSDLKFKIHSTKALPILKQALRDWFNDAKSTVGRNPTRWWERCQEFTQENFTILNEKVTGLILIETYYGRKYTRVKGVNPIKRHVKEFLNYLYDNQVQTE